MFLEVSRSRPTYAGQNIPRSNLILFPYSSYFSLPFFLPEITGTTNGFIRNARGGNCWRIKCWNTWLDRTLFCTINFFLSIYKGWMDSVKVLRAGKICTYYETREIIFYRSHNVHSSSRWKIEFILLNVSLLLISLESFYLVSFLFFPLVSRLEFVCAK